jgi:hypothetical protein
MNVSRYRNQGKSKILAQLIVVLGYGDICTLCFITCHTKGKLNGITYQDNVFSVHCLVNFNNHQLLVGQS